MRLTKKTNIENEFNCNYLESEELDLIDEESSGKAATILFNKLGQLEDLEEEYAIQDTNDLRRRLDLADKYGELSDQLGIDLITLYKIISHGFYVRRTNGYISWVMPGEFMLYKDGMSEGWECPTTFYFKDYGKTWGLDKNDLTKEELEK